MVKEIEDNFEDVSQNQNYEEIETGSGRIKDEEAKWFFDYSKLYWEIKSKLMSGELREDKDGNFIIRRPKGARALLTSVGIEETMAIINSSVTKIQALSIVDEERIKAMCLTLGRSLVDNYYVNMEKYGLDPSRATMVLRIIMNLVETNLRKSLEGKALIITLQNETVREVRTDKAKKGFWPFG